MVIIYSTAQYSTFTLTLLVGVSSHGNYIQYSTVQYSTVTLTLLVGVSSHGNYIQYSTVPLILLVGVSSRCIYLQYRTLQYSHITLIGKGIHLLLFMYSKVQASTVIKRRFISWYHVYYSTVQNSTGLYDTVTLIPPKGIHLVVFMYNAVQDSTVQ